MVQDKVVAYQKYQQNKVNAGLTDHLHNTVTLSAKKRQIQTKYKSCDFFFLMQ